ncbi:MAG: PrsW family glutamic-type intramembrane protease [Anaerolineales bacterium]
MKTNQNHYPSLLSALVFSLGALSMFGIGLAMGISTLTALFSRTEIKAQQTIFLITFGFEGIVLLAAAFFSLQKFLRRPSADEEMSFAVPGRWIAISVIVAGASILIGNWISGITTINWLFLPLLTISAVVLPLGALLALAAHKLPFGTRWQTWNVLGLTMSLVPLLLVIVEMIIGMIFFFVVIVYIFTDPELSIEMQDLWHRIMFLGPNSEETADLLIPFLTRPGVILIALGYIAVLVPAVEEIFKPLGVWLFAGKLDSPGRGFVLGALCGAGYALIETVGVSGQTSEWANLLIARIGTGLLHITTSALMGAAIVLARQERRYRRLFGTYLFAVLLHGLWNALATLFTFSDAAELFEQPGMLSGLQPAMVAMMSILAVVLFLILVVSNRRQVRLAAPHPIPPTVGEETSLEQTA